jgi:hypothetical protein
MDGRRPWRPSRLRPCRLHRLDADASRVALAYVASTQMNLPNLPLGLLLGTAASLPNPQLMPGAAVATEGAI